MKKFTLFIIIIFSLSFLGVYFFKKPIVNNPLEGLKTNTEIILKDKCELKKFEDKEFGIGFSFPSCILNNGNSKREPFKNGNTWVFLNKDNKIFINPDILKFFKKETSKPLNVEISNRFIPVTGKNFCDVKIKKDGEITYFKIGYKTEEIKTERVKYYKTADYPNDCGLFSNSGMYGGYFSDIKGSNNFTYIDHSAYIDIEDSILDLLKVQVPVEQTFFIVK